MLGRGRNPAVLSRGDGADDESSRRAIEGDGEEDHLVGGGGNYWGDGSDDATVAGAAGNGWLLRAGGPAQGKAERAADTFGDGGEGTRALQGYVLRSEHPTLPRKAAGGACDPVELHVGAESAARSWAGCQAAQARSSPAETATPADGRDAAAHRRQQASVVERRPMVRPDCDSGRCQHGDLLRAVG